MICSYCGKEITDVKYRTVAFDRPYLNLRFHPDCLTQIDDMAVYVEENLSRFLKAESTSNSTKKTKKARGK